MNGFRCSVREVVYVVKVADLTIRKRLHDFKDTKSGDLTVEELGIFGWSKRTSHPAMD
ncbi:hypothetical protein HOY80DRAFT_975909 [Tuber brumale]|nr:hypothetical protein HOY80DRAFT_975909 [Tuber brumale]